MRASGRLHRAGRLNTGARGSENRLRVALHTPFVVNEHSGISRYIRGLLHALADVDPKTEYVCFWPPEAPWPDALPPADHAVDEVTDAINILLTETE